MAVINLYNGEVKIDVDFSHLRHSYKIKNKKIESVSSIIGIVGGSPDPLMFWAVNCGTEYLLEKLKRGEQIIENDVYEAGRQYQIKKKDACDVGSAIHDWALAYGRKEDPEMPTDERILNGVIGFMDWVKNNQVQFMAMEKVVYSKKWNYIGRTDLIAVVNGRARVIDYKSGKLDEGKIPKYKLMGFRLQLAAYKLAWEEEHGQLDGSGIVYFDKQDGAMSYWETEENDSGRFLEALSLYRWQKGL